jgi:hypothetical protein
MQKTKLRIAYNDTSKYLLEMIEVFKQNQEELEQITFQNEMLQIKNSAQEKILEKRENEIKKIKADLNSDNILKKARRSVKRNQSNIDHPLEASRTILTYQASPTQFLTKKRKTSHNYFTIPCVHYLKGSCSVGRYCTFDHPPRIGNRKEAEISRQWQILEKM